MVRRAWTTMIQVHEHDQQDKQEARAMKYTDARI